MYSYKQEKKNKVRHKIIQQAVEDLTIYRNTSCCVSRNYPRMLYDYFCDQEETKEKNETMKIDLTYLLNWERLHDSCMNYKKPDELSVCYLAGPEPQNDFNEFVNLGVLPQNIWAFENDKNTYRSAVKELSGIGFPKPKILKMPFEQFMKATPKKFDIIYFDACGSLISDKHVMRNIASIFKFHRINSPGIIISNIASVDFSDEEVLTEYLDILSLYFWCKDNNNEKVVIKKNKVENITYLKLRAKIKSDIFTYYSKFITLYIMDLGSVIIPILRFCNSNLINCVISDDVNKKKFTNSIDEINKIQNNKLFKFFSLINFTNQSFNGMINDLIYDSMGLDNNKIDIFSSFKLIETIRNNTSNLKKEILEINSYVNTMGNIYQFLDKPSSNLFVDTIINQLSYPLHYVTSKMRSYQYKAKQTNMLTDVCVFDECRYIYDWLPTINQMQSSFNDLSWQYIFRFALDGLIKNRINYNNEFYFQSSVVSTSIENFKGLKLSERNII